MRKKFAQCQEREGGTISKSKLQEIKLKANEGCLQKNCKQMLEKMHLARVIVLGLFTDFPSAHSFS